MKDHEENAGPLCLTVTNVHTTKRSTLSKMCIGPRFICFLLEDGFKPRKIPGETRIPYGQFPIVPYRFGKFFNRYRERYGHEFVPLLQDVTGFTAILIHLGNDVEDTRGCLLTGMEAKFEPNLEEFRVMDSVGGYQRLYKILKKAFDEGREVILDIGR